MRIVLAALGLLSATAAAAGGDLTPALGPYRDAERAGAIGTITGRIFAEGRTPSAPDTPIAPSAVILMPRSEDFLTSIETIKRGARNSSDAYRTAALQIRKTREAYEKRLWESGAADLVRPTTVASDGTFRFDQVPAGRWMIVAVHDTYHATGGSRSTPQGERLKFDMTPRVRGYNASLVWLREIDVTMEAVEQVEFTDRNLWFSGVVEDKERDAGR